MFEWPRFAAHLCADRSPADRVASLLAELAQPAAAEPDVKQVLETVFDDGELVDGLRAHGARLDHVGMLAPGGVGFADAVALVAASPFRMRQRTFKSVALAKDLSARFGRTVDVMVVEGATPTRSVRCPAVEVFVAELSSIELEAILAQEIGCHVALALRADTSFEAILELLHAHQCWELPVMRSGPLTNREINSRLLYVDVVRDGRTRRLEFIASATP